MLELSTEELVEMINWAADCRPFSVRPTPAQAVRYVERQYPGGVPAFRSMVAEAVFVQVKA